MEKGIILDGDPDVMSLSVLGMIDLLLTQWLIHGRDYDIESIWNKFKNIVGQGLFKQ